MSKVGKEDSEESDEPDISNSKKMKVGSACLAFSPSGASSAGRRPDTEGKKS
jgi:hypothetical protein